MAKVKEELADMHLAFKEHIRLHRPAIADVGAVATGEAWLAVQAKARGKSLLSCHPTPTRAPTPPLAPRL